MAEFIERWGAWMRISNSVAYVSSSHLKRRWSYVFEAEAAKLGLTVKYEITK